MWQFNTLYSYIILYYIILYYIILYYYINLALVAGDIWYNTVTESGLSNYYSV
jgi:hypothetical protein